MQPLQQLSTKFHQARQQGSLGEPRAAAYHQALLYTLLLETSCFRYWGQGQWTDYAQTLYRRGLTAASPR
jgi:hypothetical protein